MTSSEHDAAALVLDTGAAASASGAAGSPSTPPDRGHLATERVHPEALGGGRSETADLVRALVRDQHRAVDAVLGAADALAALADAVAARVRAGGRLVYVGAGTSGRLGVLDASECPPTFHAAPGQVVGIIAGGDAALRTSSEGREDDPAAGAAAIAEAGVAARDAVVGIMAGGTTPYVHGALAEAAARGALVASLSCAVEAPAPSGATHAIVLDTGPELVAGSTRLKAGTATKIALNALTTTLYARLGRVWRGRMIDLRATNDKLRDRALRILVDLGAAASRAEADACLRAADGRVPIALLMALGRLDRAEAETRLAAADGNAAAALDQCRFPVPDTGD